VREKLLAVARGDQAADLLLTGGRVVDVFTGSVIDAEVAVVDGVIASVGPARDAVETIDLAGQYLLPGLIDAHVHLESSMVTPYEFARAVVPRGTTAVVTDPHEVANVAGLAGVQWLLEASDDLPLAVLVMAPSCVPATHLATAGAELDAADLEVLAQHPRVIGLAEVMNVPGVVLGDPAVHAKIDAFAGRPVDGHGPGLAGDWLQAYAAAGVGTDHETLTPEEALEKLRLGMRVWLREGTGARNLVDLLPVVTGATSRRCGFCTAVRLRPVVARIWWCVRTSRTLKRNAFTWVDRWLARTVHRPACGPNLRRIRQRSCDRRSSISRPSICGLKNPVPMCA